MSCLLANTFTTAEVLGSGMHRRELYGLRDDGTLVELSRGVFRWANAPAPTLPDLLAVSRRVPMAIVCCVAPAAVCDLTDRLSADRGVPRPTKDNPAGRAYLELQSRARRDKRSTQELLTLYVLRAGSPALPSRVTRPSSCSKAAYCLGAHHAFRRRFGTDGVHLPDSFGDLVAAVVEFVAPLAVGDLRPAWDPDARKRS